MLLASVLAAFAFAAPPEVAIEVSTSVEAERLGDAVEDAVRRGLERGGVVPTASATTIVRVTVSTDGADTTVKLEAIEGDSVLAESDGLCEICGDAELSTLAGDLAGRVAKRLTSAVDVGTLRIDGEPDGAAVFVDGEHRGELPLELELTPGPHVVEVTADGYDPEGYDWESVAGVTEVYRVSLRERRAPDPGPSSGSRKTMRIAGWAALAAGASFAATGAVLLAIDGTPHRPSCTPDVVDPNGLCPQSFVTRTGGIIALAGGVAALGVSVPLLVIGHRASEENGDASPEVSLGIRPGGAFIRGRF